MSSVRLRSATCSDRKRRATMAASRVAAFRPTRCSRERPRPQLLPRRLEKQAVEPPDARLVERAQEEPAATELVDQRLAAAGRLEHRIDRVGVELVERREPDRGCDQLGARRRRGVAHQLVAHRRSLLAQHAGTGCSGEPHRDAPPLGEPRHRLGVGVGHRHAPALERLGHLALGPGEILARQLEVGASKLWIVPARDDQRRPRTAAGRAVVEPREAVAGQPFNSIDDNCRTVAAEDLEGRVQPGVAARVRHVHTAVGAQRPEPLSQQRRLP